MILYNLWEYHFELGGGHFAPKWRGQFGRNIHIGYIRSLYEYLFGVYIDDEDICGSEESRIGNITLQDIDVKLKFDLIPNPANSSITIRLTHDRKGPFNVKVLSTQGQILLNEQKSTKESLLNIGEFGPGIYIVKISDGKQESFRKLVILK